MPDKKVTQLDLAAGVALDDLLMVVDVSANRNMRITVNNFLGPIVPPIDAQYVTMAAHAGLPNERVLIGTVDQVIVTDGGPGANVTLSLPQDIGLLSTPTFAGITINGNIIVTGLVDAVDIAGANAASFVTLAASAFHANERILTGTANQINITDAGPGGNVTLSTPQDIGLLSTPTFGGLTINGNILVTGTVDGVDLAGIAAASFVTMAASVDLANERVLIGTANQITVTDGGAGGNVTISLPSDINLTGASSIGTTAGNLTLDPAGNIVLNSVGGTIDIDDGIIDLSTQTVDVSLNNAVDALNFDANTLSIDALNNRVGIRTAAPEHPLDVSFTNIANDIIGIRSAITQTANNNVTAMQFFGIGQDATIANVRGIQGVNYLYAASANLTVTSTASVLAGTFIRSAAGRTVTVTTLLSTIAIDAPIILDPAGTITVPSMRGLYISNQGNARWTLSYGIYIDAQSGSAWPHAILARSGLAVFNDSFSATADFIVRGNTVAATFVVDVSANAIGMGIAAPTGTLHVDQTSNTAAKPVLVLDQADIDQVLMKVIGVAEAASANRTLVADSDFGTPGSLVGWIQVEIQDDGNRVTDGDYYIPFYNAPS